MTDKKLNDGAVYCEFCGKIPDRPLWLPFALSVFANYEGVPRGNIFLCSKSCVHKWLNKL